MTEFYKTCRLIFMTQQRTLILVAEGPIYKYDITYPIIPLPHF